MEAQTRNILLTEIKEYHENPRGDITPDSINELAESLKTVGLLSAITIRPLKKGYQIVAGSRRFNAAKSIGWKEISCNIRELSDEQAFEIAVIENLQREDVHPLDEAKAFDIILKKSTIQELSKRINKSESYIAKRLKLNDLIEPIKKLYYSGALELGHCIELCRLIPDDQKKCIDCIERREDSTPIEKKERKIYSSPKELRHFIETEILTLLSAAAFKKDDAELYKKAGACLSCPKRSGANKTLFNDIQKDDVCFDKKCFEIKCNNFIDLKIKELRDDGHDIHLMVYSYGDNSIRNKYKDYNVIEASKYSPAYNNWKKTQNETKNSVKVIWVEGPETGHVINIEFKKENQSGTTKTPAENLPAPVQIAKIQDRVKRAIEIDRARVYTPLREQVIEKISCFNDDKFVKQPEITALEKELFWFAVYKLTDHPHIATGDFSLFVEKMIKINQSDSDDEKNKISQRLRGITPEQEIQLMRVFIRSTLLSENAQFIERDAYLYNAFVELGKLYNTEETEKILNTQDSIRAKREKNADARIKLLKEEIKKKKSKSNERKNRKAKK